MLSSRRYFTNCRRTINPPMLNQRPSLKWSNFLFYTLWYSCEAWSITLKEKNEKEMGEIKDVWKKCLEWYLGSRRMKLHEPLSEHTYSDHSWRCLPQPGTKRREEGIQRMEDAGTSEEDDNIDSQDSNTPIDHDHLARNCSTKIITPAVKASVVYKDYVIRKI